MRIVVLIFLLGFVACASNAQINLAHNSSFEQTAPTGLPVDWWLSDSLGKTAVAVDRAVAHSGRASVRLHANEKTKCVLVGKSFDAYPADQIKFSVWVRGENIPAAHALAYAGVAFRRADGSVLGRSYFSGPAAAGWSLLSGTAKVPADASSAELHLGYTNAPGTIWFDDVSAEIIDPVSFALSAPPEPWVGEQLLSFHLANRQSTPFQGRISATAANQTKSIPIEEAAASKNELKVPISFPAIGSHAYKITLLDASGDIVRVVQGKIVILPPLTLFPPCPCYQLEGTGDGKTRLDAKINLPSAKRHGLKLQVDVLNAAGEKVASASTMVGPVGEAGVEFTVPVQTSGVFEARAQLLDAAGEALGATNCQIHIIPPGAATTALSANGFPVVNGKPIFPIGLYNCGRYEEMAAAGFNATHAYGISAGKADEPINSEDSRLLELLDEAMTNGMRMMAELPRQAIEKGDWNQVRRRIETFKNHPGLLCWGSEERVARGTAPLSNIAKLYSMVHELDPGHPFVLGDTRTVIQELQVDRRDFFPDSCMDVGIWWWYPIPLTKPTGDALSGEGNSALELEPPSWLTTTLSKKPLWIAIQAYQKPDRAARFPTPEEYRCQAYLSIINGVKGLFFYTGFGQRDFQGKPSGLLNKPEAAHWDYVKSLVTEMRAMSPAFMAPISSAKPQISPAKVPVEYAVRELDGNIYLLAANKSAENQRANFQSDMFKGKKVEVLYESRIAPLTIQDNVLQDEFSPLAVHVYRLN